jgi:hypothetical protein
MEAQQRRQRWIATGSALAMTQGEFSNVSNPAIGYAGGRSARRKRLFDSFCGFGQKECKESVIPRRVEATDGRDKSPPTQPKHGGNAGLPHGLHLHAMKPLPSFCLDAKRSKKSRLYPRGYLLWFRSLNKIKLASLKQHFVPGVHYT